MSQNPNNIFLKQLPLTVDWAKAITDSEGNLKISMIPPENAADKFELVVTKKEGQLIGKIIQYRRSTKSKSIFSDVPVTYSLNGYLETIVNPDNTNTTAKQVRVGYSGQYLDTNFLDPGVFLMSCYPDELKFDDASQMCTWPIYAETYSYLNGLWTIPAKGSLGR